MLISSNKIWSSGLLGRTKIIVWLWTSPIVLVGGYLIVAPLLQSDGNLFEALKALTDMEPAAGSGKYAWHPLSLLILIALLFGAIMLMKLGRLLGRNSKFGIFNANNTIDIEPNSSWLEKKGALIIKGKQGSARLRGPYIEVFLNDQYIVGFMGDEGVRLILPPNDYQICLRLSSFADSKQGANANLIQTKHGGPLREEIQERNPKPAKNYHFTFPVKVTSEEEVTYFCRINYSFRKLLDTSGQPISKLKKLALVIKAWKARKTKKYRLKNAK